MTTNKAARSRTGRALRRVVISLLVAGLLLSGWRLCIPRTRQASTSPEVRLKDSGYSQVQMEGKMHLSFETALFVPDGMGERCWLGWCDPAVSDTYEALASKAPTAERQYFWAWGRFEGLLSPPSPTHYGHMNSYAREFVITRVLALKPSNQASTNSTQPGNVPDIMGEPGNGEPRK
jgi:hypothetical protein